MVEDGRWGENERMCRCARYLDVKGCVGGGHCWRLFESLSLMMYGMNHNRMNTEVYIAPWNLGEFVSSSYRANGPPASLVSLRAPTGRTLVNQGLDFGRGSLSSTIRHLIWHSCFHLSTHEAEPDAGSRQCCYG